MAPAKLVEAFQLYPFLIKMHIVGPLASSMPRPPGASPWRHRSSGHAVMELRSVQAAAQRRGVCERRPGVVGHRAADRGDPRRHLCDLDVHRGRLVPGAAGGNRLEGRGHGGAGAWRDIAGRSRSQCPMSRGSMPRGRSRASARAAAPRPAGSNSDRCLCCHCDFRTQPSRSPRDVARSANVPDSVTHDGFHILLDRTTLVTISPNYNGTCIKSDGATRR